MILKLTCQQAEALKYLFEKAINPEEPDNVAERLVKALMWDVYRKLRDRLEKKSRQGYSLSLNDKEAMAFYMYFQNRLLGPNWLYEQVVVNKLIADLDRKYA